MMSQGTGLILTHQGPLSLQGSALGSLAPQLERGTARAIVAGDVRRENSQSPQASMDPPKGSLLHSGLQCVTWSGSLSVLTFSRRKGVANV
jgi:hypothetical protein